jgi:hypothetical protein
LLFLLSGWAEIFAAGQVVERGNIEKLQKSVGCAVVRYAPFGLRSLDPQEAAADQMGQDVTARLAAQTP